MSESPSVFDRSGDLLFAPEALFFAIEGSLILLHDFVERIVLLHPVFLHQKILVFCYSRCLQGPVRILLGEVCC